MNERHLNEDYKIIIKLRIFSKFTIIKIILTEKKLKRLNLQQEAKIIKTRIIENKSKIDKNGGHINDQKRKSNRITR